MNYDLRNYQNNNFIFKPFFSLISSQNFEVFHESYKIRNPVINFYV